MSNNKGFSLIEMTIVLAIIGIILAISYPSLTRSMANSKENERARQEIVVNKALKQYYALMGKYPKYKLPDQLSELSNDLSKQTGVMLDVADYNYSYSATCIGPDGDGKFEIRSLHVDSR